MRMENYFPGVYISVNTRTAFTDRINLSNSQAEQKKSQSWMKALNERSLYASSCHTGPIAALEAWQPTPSNIREQG